MDTTISIRKAQLSDSKKLSILFQQVYIQTYALEGVSDEYANFISVQFSAQKIEEKISFIPDSLWVAEYKNNLVGVAQIDFEKECPIRKISMPELNKLYVLEWFSKKGIGYQLLQKVEKILASKGFKELWLVVYSLNPSAIAFYERQGYECIGDTLFQMEVNCYKNKVYTKQLIEQHGQL